MRPAGHETDAGYPRDALHQHPVPLLVHIHRKGQVVAVEKAQFEGQHGRGVLHRPALEMKIVFSKVLL
jgi:hypothetical protein